VEGERRVASTKTWDDLSQESLLRGEPPRKFTEICLDDHQHSLSLPARNGVAYGLRTLILCFGRELGASEIHRVSGPSDWIGKTETRFSLLLDLNLRSPTAKNQILLG
jgi:hypothetical protein